MLEGYFSAREFAKNSIEKHIIAPESISENLNIFYGVLNGRKATFKEESRLNLCLVNAAAILFIAKKVSCLEEGMEIALESVQRGEALHKLNEFIRISNEKIKA